MVKDYLQVQYKDYLQSQYQPRVSGYWNSLKVYFSVCTRCVLFSVSFVRESVVANDCTVA